MSAASSGTAIATKPYVEKRNGGYYVVGTRVSLESVVYQFQEGQPPESILRSFPMLLSLENVYGAIAFYLAHRLTIDTYLTAEEEFSAQAPQPLQKNAPELHNKLIAAKRTQASAKWVVSGSKQTLILIKPS